MNQERILFNNVIFPMPYAVFESADLKLVQEYFLEQQLIPIIQTHDKTNELWDYMDKLPRPPEVKTVMKSLVVCIIYEKNFKC